MCSKLCMQKLPINLCPNRPEKRVPENCLQFSQTGDYFLGHDYEQIPKMFLLRSGCTVAVEIKSILIPKRLIVESEMTFFWKIIRPDFFCWDISDSEFSKWQFFVDIEVWGFLRALACIFWATQTGAGRESRDERGSDPPSSTRPEPGPKLLT